MKERGSVPFIAAFLGFVVAVLINVAIINQLLPFSTLQARTDALSDVVETIQNIVVNPVFAVAKLIAALVVIIFGTFLLRRVYGYLRRPPQLVVPEFGNASGDADLDKILKGL